MRKIVSERKIKHWQGYGSVDAKVLRKTPDNLIVQVRGMHEYGLDCGAWDHDRVYEWLVKRFDPTKTANDIVSVDIDDDYERQGNVDVEVCTYDISFKEKSTFELVRESADDETLKDIEKTYGKKTALALDKYCKLFKKTPTNVVSDLKADGNGMTEWDKFDVWARRKLKIDIMDNFDDTVDWTGAEDDKKREKEDEKEKERSARKFKKDIKELRQNKKDLKKLRRGMRKGRRLARESMNVQDGMVDDLLEKIGDYLVSDYGVDGNVEKYKFGPRIYFTINGKEYYVEVNSQDLERLVREGSGSRMDQWDIASWISDEVRDCEWANDVDFENDDYEDPWFRITTTDGDTFQVVVKKV